MKSERREIKWVMGLLLLVFCLSGFSFRAKADDVGTPVLKAAVAAEDGSINVTWNAVSGAETYRVYRKTADTKWVRIANLGAVTSYTDKDVVPTVEYIYTVRALIGKKIGGYDEAGVKAKVELEQPKLIGTITKSTNKLKVMWEKVQGASYYVVYRGVKEADSSKVSVKKIADKVKNTYYVDNAVQSGVTYVYTVRAAVVVNNTTALSPYNKSVRGKIQEEAEISFNSPKLISAEGSLGTAITVTWATVPEADGYSIYRKYSTGWKRVGTANGANRTSWTDKKVKAGASYTYTVRAFMYYKNKKILSSNWETQSVTGTAELPAPELKSAVVNLGSSVTVTWGAVEGADGYRLYRRTENSNWGRVATGNALTYTDKKVSLGTTYYYTVRAYRTVGSAKRLGAYDEVGLKAAVVITKRKENGLELYYDGNGKLITDTSAIIGSQSSYAIEIDYYKNIVTVYAKGSTGDYNLPVKAFICSTGEATPIGTFYTPEKYRWHELNGQLYGQWCTRIHGGVLFHSVYYYKYNDNMSLSTSAYNKLGTKASHGCVRLTARDAKWIYDNCRLGTKVMVKTSCANPFGKPSAYKLASSHTWDPTDPNAYYKCRERGCH